MATYIHQPSGETVEAIQLPELSKIPPHIVQWLSDHFRAFEFNHPHNNPHNIRLFYRSRYFSPTLTVYPGDFIVDADGTRHTMTEEQFHYSYKPTENMIQPGVYRNDDTSEIVHAIYVPKSGPYDHIVEWANRISMSQNAFMWNHTDGKAALRRENSQMVYAVPGDVLTYDQYIFYGYRVNNFKRNYHQIFRLDFYDGADNKSPKFVLDRNKPQGKQGNLNEIINMLTTEYRKSNYTSKEVARLAGLANELQNIENNHG